MESHRPLRIGKVSIREHAYISQTSVWFKTQNTRSIHPFVVNLDQNPNLTDINQDWFESDLSIAKSCSLIHKGLLYIYGGLVDKRQVLKLDWCKDHNTSREKWGHTKLMKVGQLQFDFTGGTCATNGAVFVLCFGSIGSRTCYRSDSPVSSLDWWTWFEPMVKSHHNHQLSLITSSPGKHESFNFFCDFFLQFRCNFRHRWRRAQSNWAIVTVNLVVAETCAVSTFSFGSKTEFVLESIVLFVRPKNGCW